MKKLAALLCVTLLSTLPFVARADVQRGTGTLTTDDGVQLHYEVSGKGPVALFIHGGPGAGTAAFKQQAGALLEGDYTVVWLDQRGSGASTSPANQNYTLERQLADFELLRNHLKVKQWTLIGNSFGGLMTQAYALKSPQTTRSMILINGMLNLPLAMDSTITHGRALLPSDQQQAIDQQPSVPAKYFATLGLLQKAKLDYQLHYASEASWKAALASAPNMPANHDMTRHIFSGDPGAYINDWASESARITVPVLVIAGEGDHIVGEKAYLDWRYPHATKVLLAGRHNVVIERPQAVREAIHRFAQTTRATR